MKKDYRYKKFLYDGIDSNLKESIKKIEKYKDYDLAYKSFQEKNKEEEKKYFIK